MRKVCPVCGRDIPADALKCEHCGSIFSSDADTGSFKGFDQQVKETLAKKYKLKGIVGKGGMAVVYKAIQLSLNRTVALKVVHENLVHDNEFLKRFIREAQISASLNHNNIVTVYDVGIEGNIHYMAMEYLPGITLRDYIRQIGGLNVEELTQYIAPIADALDYIHSRGLVHRDMKSSNIIITNDKRSVLTDFGIVYTNDDNPLSQPGAVMGTPEYMSPEQAEGNLNLDGRSDIFSLGTVMYEAVTGQMPFHAQNPLSTINQVINTHPLPPIDLNKKIPAFVNNMIIDCMAKRREKRIPKASIISQSLRNKKYSYTAQKENGVKTRKFTEEERKAVKSEITHNEVKKKKEQTSTKAPPFNYKAKQDKSRNKKLVLIGLNVVLAVFIGYLVTISFFQSSISSDEQTKYKNFVSQGDDYFNSGQYSLAMEAYTFAYEIKSSQRALLSKIEKTRNMIALATVNEKPLVKQNEDDLKEEAVQNLLNEVNNLTEPGQDIISGSVVSITNNTKQNSGVETTTTEPVKRNTGFTSAQKSVLNQFKMIEVKGYSGGDFYIAATETTQQQYKDILNTNPSVFTGNSNPVENVSYNEVLQFIDRLNTKYNMHFRLPTTQEWEFAASGGRSSINTRYSGSNSISSVAYYFENSDGSTHSVGSLSPNELGIYDMSGNVWEWVQGGVLKGGGWMSTLNSCNITGSDRKPADYKDHCTGFRLCHDVKN